MRGYGAAAEYSGVPAKIGKLSLLIPYNSLWRRELWAHPSTLRRCSGECSSLVTSMAQRGFISVGQRSTGRVMKVVNEAWPWGASIVSYRPVSYLPRRATISKNGSVFCSNLLRYGGTHCPLVLITPIPQSVVYGTGISDVWIACGLTGVSTCTTAVIQSLALLGPFGFRA